MRNTNLLTRLRTTSALSGVVAALVGLVGSSAHAQDAGAACAMINSACDISSFGSNGPDGADGGDDKPGHDGTPGGPGADITTDLEVARTLLSSGVVSPVNINSFGGTGGAGGQGDDGDTGIANNRGGNGQPGGSGGNLMVTIGPALSGTASVGPNGELVSGVTIQSIGGRGGAGGAASYELGGTGNGVANPGGNGYTIQATLGGTFTSGPGAGAYVASVGGTGGGGKEDSFGKSPQSPDGADGGVGGNVTVSVTGNYTGNNYGVYIESAAGNGGDGNSAHDAISGYQGGNGGNAGSAGAVTATLAPNATVLSTYSNGAAFYAASLGGVGGAGGKSHTAGSGGAGSDGAPVTASINGNVYTSGYGDSYGVLVQSLGGTGGGGGHSSGWFNPVAGSGATGGNGNTVIITGTGANVKLGNQPGNENSSGVVAQSIGGGGGVGPDSNGWFAVGGNGGTGSNGNTAGITLTDTSVETFGFNSGGIVAQSIGGGGGKGGDASGTGTIVNLVVGGTGGGGGTAADANVSVLGKSLIKTHDQHSPGVEIQSIGGGGGDGGAAYSSVDAAFAGASVSVGGSGGAGGNGGTVNIARTENNGANSQIITSNSDSYGILGQSVGGGGGNGGASTAKSVVKGGDYPSQSLALATGGSGGIAGSARDTYLQNSGLVATSGSGSVGIAAQAIGGGGGNAGDASATASASGHSISLAVSLAFGGSGGAAGDGGNVEAMNRGLVLTTGGSATGMLVQSIGGGGGNGGSGDAKSDASSDVKEGGEGPPGGPSKSLSFSVGSGGSGGGAGNGYNATATNTGAILTLGDAAHGILAQTIGGGGGNAGGGAASTKGDIQFDLQVGGTGGNGGQTYYTGAVNVTNGGTIVTYGADANGILAQSIGGGGGNGGKSGTSLSGGKSDKAGGNGDANGVTTTLTAIEANYTAKGGAAIGDYDYLGDATHGAIGTINALLANSTLRARLGTAADAADDIDNTAGSGGEDSDDNSAKSISLGVGVGGNGGNGGAAGSVTVTNQAGATIATMGKNSDAIVAQSIGGGGGKGGNASTASSGDISGNVGVGGNGGNNSNVNANNGGKTTVLNNGAVYTVGAISAGILAQSIGGGGGIGGTSSVTLAGTASGHKGAVTATLGGSSTKANSKSDVVSVTSSGAIETRGHDSYGIIAQSIPGGGGIVKTLATDLDTANGTTVSGSSSSNQKDFAVKVQLGSNNQLVSGDAGSASVTTTAGGTIVTKGDDGIAILAQAVSGGGGLALGGKPIGSLASDFLGDQLKQGNVGSGVSANVVVGANITTSGAGGVGVFAQSVGGSGGIAGDIGHTMQLAQMGKAPRSADYVGNGTDISVSVIAGSTIKTSGGNAPGIIAQSVGGGGGWITNNDYAYIGSAGGTGLGGFVTVNVQGVVDANGGASAGIFAQSAGGATNGGVGLGNNITITIGDPSNICTDGSKACAAAVFGGNGFGPIASAVYVRNGGFGNVVTNYGVINTHESTDGYAFYADNASLRVLNYGIVTGNTNIGGNFVNEPGATYVTLSTVNLNGGTLTNDGVVDVRGTTVDTTTLTGNYVSTGNGRLVVDTDHIAGTGDKLVVTGTARIAGIVEVRPSSVSNKPVTVLTAAGGVTLDPTLRSVANSQLFDFTPQVAGNTLVIQPKANLAAAASVLGNNRQAVAGNLQALFDSGASFDRGFNTLLKVNDAASYARSLDALSGQALGALGAFRINSSRAFIGNLYGGCERHGVERDGEGRCLWARAFYTATTQNENVDELGYHAKGTGFQLGSETQLSDNWYLSGAVAYENSRFRDDDRTARIKGDSALGGLSLRYVHDRLEVSGALDAGYGWYRSRRQIVLGGLADEAQSKPNQWEAGAHANAAYTFDLGRSAYARPYTDLHVIHVHSKSFAETGNSPFNLAVDAQSQTAVAGGVGLEIGGRLPLKSGGALRPFASAGVEFASNSDWTTTARFVGQAGGDSFDIRTAAPNTYGRFAVGLELLGASNIDLSLSYNPEIGKDYVSHAGVAKLTYRF